jgi:hypothetical protein
MVRWVGEDFALVRAGKEISAAEGARAMCSIYFVLSCSTIFATTTRNTIDVKTTCNRKRKRKWS